jgi:hypothetical protein
MQYIVFWHLNVTIWEKQKMVFDMLLNFFIISYQVPSMILMIEIEKVYNCALVGVHF